MGRFQSVVVKSAVLGLSLMPPSMPFNEASALVNAGLRFMLELLPTACSITLLA
jgi:hypothetical protein